ncbi:nitroreductase family deazaflavin-dependent oxidoreductase [Saccharopolyspora gloriosae]|uniref:nitroreductase family deazaflavin-dependent oxidoreductase n=1 Tax=Saccharopolyspora gloriosae TaxID=455344 RepID=UPI001FB5CA8B|nr:nitroreductase family deazaflavin-dependent oxidoreductase [Saccharopolyspora gloriosae]
MHGNEITTTVAARYNAPVIEEFRANGGLVGGAFAGHALLLLNSTGARTGRNHVTPLSYLEENGEYLVFASKAGADIHPDWYFNLRANPDARIEVGAEVLDVRAGELIGVQRDVRFAQLTGLYPYFAEYQAKTERVFPVLALTPTG